MHPIIIVCVVDVSRISRMIPSDLGLWIPTGENGARRDKTTLFHFVLVSPPQDLNYCTTAFINYNLHITQFALLNYLK